MSGRSITRLLKKRKREEPATILTGKQVVEAIKAKKPKKEVNAGNYVEGPTPPVQMDVEDYVKEENMSETPVSTEEKKRIPAAEFVKAWQRSESVNQVAVALSTNTVYASARAAQLRKQGVRLKKFTRGKGGKRLDVAALNALLEDAPPGSTDMPL